MGSAHFFCVSQCSITEWHLLFVLAFSEKICMCSVCSRRNINHFSSNYAVHRKFLFRIKRTPKSRFAWSDTSTKSHFAIWELGDLPNKRKRKKYSMYEYKTKYLIYTQIYFPVSTKNKLTGIQFMTYVLLLIILIVFCKAFVLRLAALFATLPPVVLKSLMAIRSLFLFVFNKYAEK